MYYVDISGEVRNQIRRLFQRACEEDRGELFLSAMKHIHERLKHDPLEFGEPLYDLKLIRLHVRTAAVIPLVLIYSVSLDHPILVIRNFRLMRNGGFSLDMQ